MESGKENERGALSTSAAPQEAPDPEGDSNCGRRSGSGKRPSIGEDDGGGAEAKLFGKGLAATSLLQIAIRNGIYQNQVASAVGGGATKYITMPATKTASIYNLTSASGTTSVNSLLGRRRHRHKRNLSLGAPPTAAVTSSPAEAAGAAVAASPLSTLSLDRRTFLRQKQCKQLQASDKTWLRADLRRGCIHVHDWLTPAYPRPVLCTVDTTAKEVADKLEGSKAGSVVRMSCKVATLPDLSDNCRDVSVESDEADSLSDSVEVKRLENMKLSTALFDDKTASNSSSELCLNEIGVDMALTAVDYCGVYSGSDMESSTCEDFSPGGPRSTELQDSLSDGLGVGTDSSVLSPNCDSATEGPDPFESSSDEVDLSSSPAHATSRPSVDSENVPSGQDSDTLGEHLEVKVPSKCSSSSQTRPLTSQASEQPEPELPREGRGWSEPISTCPSPALFIQLHGGTVRRLGDDEKPLQILNEYLSDLGFEDPWRIQSEGMNPEIGCLIRFYFGENFLFLCVCVESGNIPV